MQWICYWQQRQLARHLVTGEPIRPTSSLARHLAQCPACAEAHRDLAHLHSEVAHVLPRVTVSSEFESTLQTRLSVAMASASPHRSFPALTVVWGFLAVGVIVLAIGWHGTQTEIAPRSPLHHSGSSVAATHRPSRPVRQVAIRGTGHALSQQRHIQIAQRARALPQRLYTATTRRHRRRMQTDRHRMTVPVVPAIQIVCATSNWQQVGQVYAACGDHGSAYRAYAQAFAEQPDLDMAIAASDSAAQTGDLSQAMAAYARVLSMGTENDSTTIPNSDEETKARNQ